MKTNKNFNGLTVNANPGDNVSDTIREMISLSKRSGVPVQTTFNGANFSVTAETTEEEAYALWKKTMDDNHEAWENSPAGKKAAEEEKAREEQELKDNTEVDEKIKDEVLELSAPVSWQHSIDVNTDDYGKGVIKYAERWGKLMQAEMKNQETDVLTEAIIRATEFKADNLGMSGASAGFARNLLICCWKHGFQLGLLKGFSKKEIHEARMEAEAEK